MKHARNSIDRTGQKYHRITFLEFVDRAENGAARWKVRCDCGTEFIALATNVTCGGTKSCGCYRNEQNRNRHKMRHAKSFQDLTGQRMHKLTFIRWVGRNQYGNAIWKMRCDCGVEFETLATLVKKGETTSCGCIRKSKCAEIGKLNKNRLCI